jgi:hypothetical protein
MPRTSLDTAGEAWDIDMIRDDLARFAFLPGGNDSEQFFPPGCQAGIGL